METIMKFEKSQAAVDRLTPSNADYPDSGTERPFTGEYNDNKEPGIYVDIVSGERCSLQRTSSIRVLAGPASPSRSSRQT
jgi:peptide methionine sulfoxide reductase MsrB